MAMQRATQAEIARRTGVCQATVSLVLSKHEGSAVSADTRARILATAQELGYTPNRQRARRQAVKTGYIGFVLRQDRNLPEVQAHQQRFQVGVLETLRAHNYHLAVDVVTPENLLPALLQEHRVDGLLVDDYFDEATIRRFSAQVPCVLLNYTNEALPVDSVMPDNLGGIGVGINHLAALGHARIAVFGSEPTLYHIAERLMGYHAALMRLDLPRRDDYIAVLEPRRLHDPAEMEAYAHATLCRWMSLPEPPTAIQALSDNYVLYLLRAARELGVRVPEQVSILGFDNLPFCDSLQPALSSIEQPMEEMGRLAGRLLIERIEGAPYPPRRLRVNASLVARASVVAPG
jgi:LacI family transcriptional regulator